MGLNIPRTPYHVPDTALLSNEYGFGALANHRITSFFALPQKRLRLPLRTLTSVDELLGLSTKVIELVGVYARRPGT